MVPWGLLIPPWGRGRERLSPRAGSGASSPTGHGTEPPATKENDAATGPSLVFESTRMLS